MCRPEVVLGAMLYKEHVILEDLLNSFSGICQGLVAVVAGAWCNQTKLLILCFI